MKTERRQGGRPSDARDTNREFGAFKQGLLESTRG